jgi:hypothetical protein
MASETPLHWKPSGMFELAVVGTSFYDKAIASVAQNPFGSPAMVFCTATLVPEHDNPHDPAAVAVYIGGVMVGHLNQNWAKSYRHLLHIFGMPLQATTCDAVITSGAKTVGKSFNYSIELDVDHDPETPGGKAATYPTIERRNPVPEFTRQSDGSYVVLAWLPRHAIGNLHKTKSVYGYTLEEWSEFVYFAANTQNINPGHRLFAVPKAINAQVFGCCNDDEVDGVVLSISGRVATVQLAHSKA